MLPRAPSTCCWRLSCASAELAYNRLAALSLGADDEIRDSRAPVSADDVSAPPKSSEDSDELRCRAWIAQASPEVKERSLSGSEGASSSDSTLNSRSSRSFGSLSVSHDAIGARRAFCGASHVDVC